MTDELRGGANTDGYRGRIHHLELMSKNHAEIIRRIEDNQNNISKLIYDQASQGHKIEKNLKILDIHEHEINEISVTVKHMEEVQESCKDRLEVLETKQANLDSLGWKIVGKVFLILAGTGGFLGWLLGLFKKE